MKASPKPAWLKAPVRLSPERQAVENLLKKHSLHTVCQEAACPNMGDCFHRKTATFLILGSVCTRNCRFCNVTPGIPQSVTPNEADEILKAVDILDLKHVVITSVTRDDLHDGGASHFAKVINRLRKSRPSLIIEVLIPDLRGSRTDLLTILRAKPDVLNHNLETVPCLYPNVRPQADYNRSLSIISMAKVFGKGLLTKSGLMLGLGETEMEVMECLMDLRNIDCDILTLGQYLSPSKNHYPVVSYISPDDFLRYKEKALKMGFKKVFADPLVRSSYRAEEQF